MLDKLYGTGDIDRGEGFGDFSLSLSHTYHFVIVQRDEPTKLLN
jgi:phage anti-repressor protein